MTQKTLAGRFVEQDVQLGVVVSDAQRSSEQVFTRRRRSANHDMIPGFAARLNPLRVSDPCGTTHRSRIMARAEVSEAAWRVVGSVG